MKNTIRHAIETIRIAIETVQSAADLFGLRDALNAIRDLDIDDGIVVSDQIDMADLQSFGGDTPRDTTGIYSWDEDNYLVHNDGNWEIIDRWTTAQDRFDLDFIGRITVDGAQWHGTQWVIYSDGTYTHAIDAADWDAAVPIGPVRDDETDHYSEWCSETTCAGDDDLCARIAAGADLEGIHAGGTCAFVPAGVYCDSCNAIATRIGDGVPLCSDCEGAL